MATTRPQPRRRARPGRRLRKQLRAATIPLAIAAAVTYDYLSRHPAIAWTTGVLLTLAVCGYACRGRIRRPRPRPSRTVRNALAMSPTEFEHHIAGLLRASGHRQVVVSGGAGDLGADVIGWSRTGQLVVVQCKRYGPHSPVGSADVQRFAGTARPHHRADVAVFVTTSRFTQPATTFAQQQGIFVIDGPALAQWESTGHTAWA